jgi:Helix-turn-helix domain
MLAPEAENDTETRRSKLRNALMRWRARLRPEDVGVVSLGQRRVPGLRREEVAELAGISPEWYRKLEMARNVRVSPRLLYRLAAVLQLSDKEKIELFSLAMDELYSVPWLREISA